MERENPHDLSPCFLIRSKETEETHCVQDSYLRRLHTVCVCVKYLNIFMFECTTKIRLYGFFIHRLQMKHLRQGRTTSDHYGLGGPGYSCATLGIYKKGARNFQANL